MKDRLDHVFTHQQSRPGPAALRMLFLLAFDSVCKDQMKRHKFRTGYYAALECTGTFISEMIKFKNQKLKTKIFQIYIFVAVVTLGDICNQCKFVSIFLKISKLPFVFSLVSACRLN